MSETQKTHTISNSERWNRIKAVGQSVVTLGVIGSLSVALGNDFANTPLAADYINALLSGDNFPEKVVGFAAGVAQNGILLLSLVRLLNNHNALSLPTNNVQQNSDGSVTINILCPDKRVGVVGQEKHQAVFAGGALTGHLPLGLVEGALFVQFAQNFGIKPESIAPFLTYVLGSKVISSVSNVWDIARIVKMANDQYGQMGVKINLMHHAKRCAAHGTVQPSVMATKFLGPRSGKTAEVLKRADDTLALMPRIASSMLINLFAAPAVSLATRGKVRMHSSWLNTSNICETAH